MTMIRRFNRFELKYLLDIQTALSLQQALNHYMDPDAHGGNKGYDIASIYYDSPELDFFWDKIEGIKYRRKLRIRAYLPDSPQAIQQVMVEIKQRINKTVQKRRLLLPLSQALELCEGHFKRGDLDSLDTAVASEVQYLVRARHLQPTCMITYHRLAFVGKLYNPGLRVTFDTEVQCRTHHLAFDPPAENHYFLPPNYCILEVKVNDTVPDWLVSLLNHHNCELHRISKYCAGLAHVKQIHVTERCLAAKHEPVAVPMLKDQMKGMIHG